MTENSAKLIPLKLNKKKSTWSTSYIIFSFFSSSAHSQLLMKGCRDQLWKQFGKDASTLNRSKWIFWGAVASVCLVSNNYIYMIPVFWIWWNDKTCVDKFYLFSSWFIWYLIDKLRRYCLLEKKKSESHLKTDAEKRNWLSNLDTLVVQVYTYKGPRGTSGLEWPHWVWVPCLQIWWDQWQLLILFFSSLHFSSNEQTML